MEPGLANQRVGMVTSHIAASLDSAVVKTVADRVPPAVRAALDESRAAGEARALRLLRELINLPETITLDLKDGVLKVSGSLEEPAHSRLIQTANALDYIERLDLSEFANPTAARLESDTRRAAGDVARRSSSCRCRSSCCGRADPRRRRPWRLAVVAPRCFPSRRISARAWDRWRARR